MSEAVQIAIVSSGAALLGGIIGYVASAIQAKMSFERQKDIESNRRSWDKEDSARERQLSALNRRLGQVEEFIGYVTEDFQNIRHAAIFIIQSEDPEAIQVRIHEYGSWRDEVPKRIYAYGASVKSLGSAELVASWQKLYGAFESLRQLYIQICNDKERDPGRHPQGVEILAAIDTQYQEFNNGLGKFISELDRIRAGAPREQNKEGA